MQNIQVNMQFNADTSNALSQIQQLQNTLRSIATTHVNVQGGSIDQAVQSAQLLSQHLTAATNVNTGKLDFTKLQTSLKASNTDLTTLTNNLLAMGPKGQQAFSQVANAVAHAELSVKKTNSALAAFGTTLMNTIKWQAASTLIHGVMSAFSSAVGHIEKLDSALNKIQIVTGKTSAEMAGFAKRAQELSRALSSTTEEYAKASLIFFQQGLGEKEVLERTEATIKMAKVTGDAVQTVSDQLTAIWNNFDNGTQSLEYYVDVITALGAATASSTSEISDGLQKFAAIAETVGLSYEYAATALATVTAETRQSADVVGTAFKTLFARMEGLKLGETLDDGTTLNQYSQAMLKAGINIKDANGNLKDMDVILDEMGTKWQTLNKDQQVALAQQVGGIRQYNQLIALMDNWDTFKINLEIAEDSEGTLDKQMAVYQGSIEASEKALQNAKETLYETLFNSDMLKSFNNGLADILEMFTRIVDKAGGLQGLLKFGGLLLLKTLLPNLMGFVTKITGSISNVIGLTKKQKINEVDNLSKTQKKIANPNAEKSPHTWGGLSEKRDARMAAGKSTEGIDKRIQKKEDALQSHKDKAANAESGGFKERWHSKRAEQLETQAEAGKGPTRSTLGVKSSNLPQTPTQDKNAGIMATQTSAGTMAQNITQESAGYTAAILDAKKEMLMIEDSLTEKQRAQFKNYEDQINAENDLLSAARERQLLAKQEADKKSGAASAAVEGSVTDEQMEETRQSEIQKTLKDSGAQKKKDDADALYAERQAKIAEEEAALAKDEEELNSGNLGKGAKKKKKAALAERRSKLEADKKTAETDHDTATTEYDKEVQEATDKVDTDPNLSKKVNFAGESSQSTMKALTPQVKEGAAPTVAQTMTQDVLSQVGDGAGGAVASVENLEKLGALQGQYNADAQTAVALQGELGTAIGVAGDKAQKGTKAYEAGNKSLKQAGSFAQKYSKEVGAAADEMAASGKYTDKQIQAVKTLAKEGAQVDLENMDPADLQAIQAALGKVEGGLNKAGAAAGQMADGMADDMANATGATKETFTQVTAGAQQLAVDTANADQQATKLQTTMSHPIPIQPDPYGGLVMGAQGAMQAITSMAMGAQMLSMGLQTAFDPDATGIEKLTGLMMIMQGVQSLLNLTTAAGNIVNGVSNVIGAIAIGIKEKGFGAWIKEIALKGLDTAATVVNAVAKVFNAHASQGLAGVIVAVLAAALIVGTIAMVANTVATEKSTEKAQENADKKKAQADGAREAAEAAREELDAVVELTDAYMDALKVYEETGEGKEALVDAAFAAVDAMGIEGHELEILAGNYANLTKKIKEYNDAKAGRAVQTSNTSLAAGGAAFLAQENVKGTGGMWTKTFGGQKYLTMALGGGSGDETALKRWKAANPDSPWEIYDDGDGGYVRAPYTSNADIPYLMSEFYTMYDGVAAIATADEQSEMEFFSEANEMRDSGTWDQGKEIADAYNTHTDTSIAAGKAVHLTGVGTQAEYMKGYEQMVEYALKAHNITDRNSREAKQVIEKLEADLAKDEDYKDFELKRRAINSLDEKGGYAGEYYENKKASGKTALQEWAEENGYTEDEALDLFVKVNPHLYDTEEQIDEAMDQMQKYIDAQRLIVKFDLIAGAKKALKETMTSADWSKFYTDYKELFDPTSDSYIGMDFKTFTNKSHSERTAILNNSQGSKVDAINMQIESEENRLNTMETDTNYKNNWINTKTKELSQEQSEKLTAKQQELDQKYTEDDKADFLANTDQATSWYNGTMTAEERQEIEDWVVAEGRWNSVDEYLAAKWEYLNANNVAGFDSANIGLGLKSEDALRGDATKLYGEEVTAQRGKVQGLKDEGHLAALEQADAKITEYELDADEVYDTANALSEMANEGKGVAAALEEDSDAAKQAAVEIGRFNKAVDDISDNYGDWMKALKSGNLSEVTKATREMSTAYANLLDMDASDFSADFLQDTQNLRDAQLAAAGDADAYNRLQKSALEDLGSQWGTYANAVTTELQKIAAIEGVNVGEKLIADTGDENTLANRIQREYDNAVQAALEGGASVEEAKIYAANAINAAGYNITSFGDEMEARTVTIKGEIPDGWKVQEDGSVVDETTGNKVEGVKYTKTENGTYEYQQTYMVRKNMQFSKKAETFGGKSPKSSGGGSKKKADEVKKKDIVDRYKEVTDSLTQNTNAMEKASKAVDGLYGMARIKNMEKVNSLLQKEINLMGKKRKEAIKYLAEDRDALKNAADKAGVKLKINDKTGNITNYTEEMTKLYKQLDTAIANANKDGNADENEQKVIDDIQEKIDNLKDAIADYEETLATLAELDQQEIDKFNEILSNNFEKINAKIELDVEFNERDLAYLEYQLSKVESDVYAQREAASYSKDQLASYSANLSTYADAYNSLNQAYANGEISQPSYVEGMKSVADGLTENLSNVRELDQAMQEYYGNTLSMAQEEISKYTDLMEHSTTVLDHYQNLMGLFGQSTDYEMMGKILNAKATVSKDAYDVSAKNYDMLKKQAEDAKTLYDDAVKAGKTGVELDILEQQWFDAQNAANEAQDQMLSDAAEWAENMRAVLENSLAGFAQQLEDALTGDFGSFDALSTEMERASSLQEEYLTTTNKIYETNKMMRTAQKEIDKTTNQMAKRKLKEFINETAAMQEQGKLSQYELDIQQAKYDLLLAEIALKEAQNAKSTVRLQRDSEGNFGYVYTADQSAIDDAQQKFEDSQNALYNKGLEGANDYAQKYTETMSEMNDALAEANQKYLDGEYKDVNEYNDAIDNIRKYYYQKLEDYSSLYQVAIGADSRVTQDAWSSAFGAMTTQTEQWKTKTEEYIGQSKDAFEKFNLALQPMKESLSGSALSIQQITQESNRLKTALTKKDGVIDSLGAVLNSVKGVTAEYITQRKELEALIATYEAYATAANNHAKDAAFDENAIAAGLEIAVKKTAAWATGVGKDEDFSDKTKAIDTSKGYTILRWDQGKNHFLISDSAGNYGWVKKSDLVGFDSGGYTGEWGPYGKMAMLHEKEMVLNQNDTENFLASMEFLHKILEVIDLQAMSSQLGGILSSPNLTNSNSSVIEQSVHIEASFPNATNHSEIEEAFNNLINTASQYANRK